ncbi:MAG: TIGR02099 family protein, partial [Gammaproteobacteria bacterium]|nr:TIGR02099 family protein [Gammaproteobacteria bacterium]
DAPDLGAMMRQLGFASVFQGGKSHASGKVWWLGAPTAFTLAGLNAQLAVSIKDGTIVDVEPGAGRLLGILSVPALPRRLFLDFRDVFKKGLAFTSVKGDIRIEQGEAYTSNLRLESVPASILVTGRTGLVAQDFAQDIYVVPNVSDTVSVASALAWGPQVAAVVVLLQEIFKSDIKAATMSRYHLSGSWREPLIRRIVEPGQQQDTPLFGE